MRYGMILLGLLLWHTAGAQQLSETRCPDNGAGTYTNPVLYADYSGQGGVEHSDVLATLRPTDKDTIPYSPAVYLDIYLQMRVRDGLCQMAYSLDGKRFKEVGEPFAMRKGKWIGAKMGLVSERTNLTFRCRMEPI